MFSSGLDLDQLAIGDVLWNAARAAGTTLERVCVGRQIKPGDGSCAVTGGTFLLEQWASVGIPRQGSGGGGSRSLRWCGGWYRGGGLGNINGKVARRRGRNCQNGGRLH